MFRASGLWGLCAAYRIGGSIGKQDIGLIGFWLRPYRVYLESPL